MSDETPMTPERTVVRADAMQCAERACRRSGCTTMRHSALSILLAQGVPVHIVARLAGHDPSVTLRTYAHAQDTAMQAAVDRLGALFGTR